MDINKLMIGDWVYNTHHKKNIKITPYDFFTHGHLNGHQYIMGPGTPCLGRDLEPIPLTPEILEKNGFDINGIPEDMVPVEDRDWSDDTYVWSKPETPDESMQVSVYMDDPYNFFIEIICLYCHVDGIHVKFVHELQHALRLCGIDKEIVI